MEILKTENLTKKYINKKALDNLNISLEKGKIYGLLGPNGSGKTTLMKIIAGLLQPSSGDIQIMDNRIGKDTKKIVSYMPTSNYLSNGMKIKHCLCYSRKHTYHAKRLNALVHSHYICECVRKSFPLDFSTIPLAISVIFLRNYQCKK